MFSVIILFYLGWCFMTNDTMKNIARWVLAFTLMFGLIWYNYQSTEVPTGRNITVTVAQGDGINTIIFRAYNYVGVDCNANKIRPEVIKLNPDVDMDHLEPGMQISVPIYVPRKDLDKFQIE